MGTKTNKQTWKPLQKKQKEKKIHEIIKSENNIKQEHGLITEKDWQLPSDFSFLLFMLIKFIAAILFLMRKFSELLRDSMQKKMDVLIKPRAN